MCSAFRCGSHDRKMALKIRSFFALKGALPPVDPHPGRPGRPRSGFPGVKGPAETTLERLRWAGPGLYSEIAQPCPVSGKLDIDQTKPNDRV